MTSCSNCKTLISKRKNFIPIIVSSKQQSRLSVRITNIEEQLCSRTIDDNNISNAAQLIKYPSPCNSKKKNEKITELLRSVCLNKEKVILFHLQLLSESRTVCSVLKMKKSVTRTLPFGKLGEHDKKQMVDFVTTALISYDSLFSGLKYAARCWHTDVNAATTIATNTTPHVAVASAPSIASASASPAATLSSRRGRPRKRKTRA
ncbi:hypothetical protein BDF21DRAFT_393500 [Thamnidium elegans]|nr:hypothetical protein BDF21DRAFT_393500 [Thamnidium elegans]